MSVVYTLPLWPCASYPREVSGHGLGGMCTLWAPGKPRSQLHPTDEINVILQDLGERESRVHKGKRPG